MKKFLTAALLALAVSGLSAVPSFAWGTFGLIPHGCCCGCCCSCNVCIRPYNAFSPVCCGSLCCDGCMPFSGGACGNGCGIPACGLPASTCMNQLPGTAPAANPTAVAGAPTQPFGQPNMAAAAAPQGGLYSAGYHPTFYPGYGYGMPQAPAAGVPPYWGSK